ncbi:hypothetical protein [Vibrio sp. WXL210]|uniref:hypothetical protein n=1 Tax=Vibrio sp. WXL210 TaxID=3450709 RepID=UPI003EC60CCA
MYRAIQVAASYRIDRINANGPVGNNHNNDGMIEAYLRSGSTFRAPFGGFIEAGNLVGLQRVKLINITVVCEDERAEIPSYRIPKNHYVVGVYLDNQLYVMLNKGAIIHFADKYQENDGDGTVHPIF